MWSQFRLATVTLAAVATVWAGAAFAQWPFTQPVARLEPGYGGICEACDLSGRILAGARMRDAVFNRADFSRAVLARADASGSRFERADFSMADLTKAKLNSARFAYASFTGALLIDAEAVGADFSAVDFSEADLTGANLTLANLSGADLRRAHGLTQAQLRAACGDRATRLPHGLRVQRCR